MKFVDKDRIDKMERFGYVYKRFKHFAIMRGYRKGCILSGIVKSSKDAWIDISGGFITLISGLLDLIIGIFCIIPAIYIETKDKPKVITVKEED